MSVYIIAQLKFTRRELYDRYQSRFMGVFKKLRASSWWRTRSPWCWKATGPATRS
ncbi:hypothetical protein [Bradyrhizobium sp. AZCC 1693]|uniref:hypothetical protein n=1 Tax=Bradyrhizobium sp. AZCC 1693 TaxID=3117029 RepID=UPI002FEE8CEB